MAAHAAPGQPYGFDLVNLERGSDGNRRTVARFICAKCLTNMLDMSVTTGRRINPIALTQQAERKGWLADPVRRARVRCPDCQTKGGNDVDAALKTVEAKMATSVPALLSSSPAPVIGSASIVPVRDPTPDQRAQLRRLLEKHFDEGLGCYLGGYSDQKIAEEANLPRVVVERLRDAAYGPIRTSPEMLAARKELDEVTAKIATLQDDAIQWAQQFGEELERLQERVTQTRATLGVK